MEYPIAYKKGGEEIKEKMTLREKSKLGRERKKFSEKLGINLPIGLISLYTWAAYCATYIKVLSSPCERKDLKRKLWANFPVTNECHQTFSSRNSHDFYFSNRNSKSGLSKTIHAISIRNILALRATQ